MWAVAVVSGPDCKKCTLCIHVCPVDAIAGAPRLMHTVLGAECTGCELCVPACPVDCIAMAPASPPATAPGETRLRTWMRSRAPLARRRYRARRARLQRAGARKRSHARERRSGGVSVAARRAEIAAAVSRVRARREALSR